MTTMVTSQSPRPAASHYSLQATFEIILTKGVSLILEHTVHWYNKIQRYNSTPGTRIASSVWQSYVHFSHIEPRDDYTNKGLKMILLLLPINNNQQLLLLLIFSWLNVQPRTSFLHHPYLNILQVQYKFESTCKTSQ